MWELCWDKNGAFKVGNLTGHAAIYCKYQFATISLSADPAVPKHKHPIKSHALKEGWDFAAVINASPHPYLYLYCTRLTSCINSKIKRAGSPALFAGRLSDDRSGQVNC
jgi:hypothetical protein